MPIDFYTHRHAKAFSASRVAALAVAIALHLASALWISLPMTALPRRHQVPDSRGALHFGGALLVDLYNKPRTTVMPAPKAINLKSDADLQPERPTFEVQRKIITFTKGTVEINEHKPTVPTIRFPSLISLVPTQTLRLPRGETWATNLPGRRFVPGTSRVIVRGFHFEPPGFNTLAGKIRILTNYLFCSQVGLYANLPPIERDRYGLTKHELRLIHSAHDCN
jgi:hypothetical protein